MATVRKRKWLSKGVEKEAWVVTYTDLLGKRRLKTYPDRATALKAKASAIKAIEKGRHPFSAGSVVNVEQAAQFYLRREDIRYRDGELSLPQYKRRCLLVERDIVPHIGKVKLDNIRPLLVQSWVDTLRATGDARRSPGTVREAVNTLQAVMNEAVRMEFVSRNMVKEVPPRTPKIPHSEKAVPSLEIVKRMLTEADPSTAIGLVIGLAIFTGMRIGEISALRWAHVSFDRSIICVREAVGAGGVIKAPKTRAGVREVPVPPKLLDHLRSWKEARAAEEADLLFGKSTAFRGTTKKVYKKEVNYRVAYAVEWAAFKKRAGIPSQFTFHSLRHVAASLYIEQGLNPKRLQTIMGHSNVDITFNRYGHVLFDDGSAHAAATRIQMQLEVPV